MMAKASGNMRFSLFGLPAEWKERLKAEGKGRLKAEG